MNIRRQRILQRMAAAALSVILGLLLIYTAAEACTTAVISGSATTDGRPLLWKNRDADNLQNQLVYNADGKFAFIGIINTGDAAGMEIWTGINSQGFAIMNTASYNLEKGDTYDEGHLMRMALESCSTIEDFQALLEKTNPGGRDVSANFGSIDAKGGAAFFETNKKTYKRFDATDPSVAPHGYLIRSNFSDSVEKQDGTGFIRRERATSLIEELVSTRHLDGQALLRIAARDIANVHIGSYPLTERKSGAPEYAYTGDSICRYITSSAVVYCGVKPGENPLASTAWVILGQPITGVAVPVWVAAGSVPKELAASPDAAPLNAAFDLIRNELYPDRDGELSKYIAVNRLTDPNWNFLQALLSTEDRNFRQVVVAIEKWRIRLPPAPEIEKLQNGITLQTLEAVQAAQKKAPGAETIAH